MPMRYESERKVYFGYYKPKNILLAISNDKKLVKNYLENHRGLSKDRYTIEKEYISDADLIVKYSDYIISEYNGFYIPEIDQIRIGMYSDTMGSELQQCENELKRIVRLSSDIKKISKKDISILVQSIEILNKMSKSRKIINKLNERSITTDDILFEYNIDSYFDSIRITREMIEMNRQYEYSYFK